MRILITGGRGQLGRSLEDALAEHQVSALGHDELDITDARAVARALDKLQPELVIHAAAWTDTAGCEADPERALLVNGEGSGVVAEGCHRAGAAMVYVSSNEVFDGTAREPYREDDAPNPQYLLDPLQAGAVAAVGKVIGPPGRLRDEGSDPRGQVSGPGG